MNNRGFAKLNIPTLKNNASNDKNKTQTTLTNNTQTFINQNSTLNNANTTSGFNMPHN